MASQKIAIANTLRVHLVQRYGLDNLPEAEFHRPAGYSIDMSYCVDFILKSDRNAGVVMKISHKSSDGRITSMVLFPAYDVCWCISSPKVPPFFAWLPFFCSPFVPVSCSFLFVLFYCIRLRIFSEASEISISDSIYHHHHYKGHHLIKRQEGCLSHGIKMVLLRMWR